MAEPASQHFGQLSELHTRYGINEPLPSYFKLRGIEEFEAWIAGIYEDDVREDLQKVSAVLNSRDCAHVSSIIKNNLEVLRDLLQRRLAALTSLQAETQEATEVLHLLLRELWARITGGSSTLSEQDTSRLRYLCGLLRTAIDQWDQRKSVRGWCTQFCAQIWALRQSRGQGPPGPVDYEVAFGDLRDLLSQAQWQVCVPRLALMDALQEPFMPLGLTEGEAQRFRHQLGQLHKRYQIFGDNGTLRVLQLRGFEAWIARISESMVREDLDKVNDVLHLNSKANFLLYGVQKCILEALGADLQQLSTALESLKNTNIPEATEVLRLLLRELRARITGGSSTLSEQDTSKLQQLCTLTQHAMVGWNQVKKPGQEVKWCELFCGQMWASLPPGLGEIAAVVDFRHVEGQAQALLASRRLKEEMMQLLKDSLQTKEELPKPSSQNDHWRCQVIEIRERLKKVEYESSASKKFCERRESDMMEEHTLPMMHFKEKLVESDKKVKMLERELKKLRDEVQGFRLKNETCSMKAAAEKLELQRELLNVRKDLHEMNLKYGRLTTNGNLKMKEDVDDFKSTRHSAKDGWQESDQSCPCQADLNDGSGSWFLIQEESEISSAISATSCFSVGTGGPFCFMPDALFKTPSGQFLSGADLYKGSQILAADWTTVLQVALPPEKQAARATLLLHAQEAKLQVTPDHRVVLGNGHLVAAAELKVGDEVMVGEQVPTKLTSIEFVPGPETVLKIAFQPDMPVAVFSPPACIHSHGHKLQEIRRAGKHCRRKGRKMTVQADSWSIPDTAPGYYSD